MPQVPQTKATWTNEGDALDSTNLHAYLRDPLAFLARRPAAMLRQTAAQSIPNGSWTPVTFGVEDLDDDPDAVGGHSTSTNTSRYTARYPGWYRVGGGVGIVSNATSIRGLAVAKNGTRVLGSDVMVPAGSGASTRIATRAILVALAEGDYVELHAWQSSGGSLNTSVVDQEQPSLAVTWDRLLAP